MKKTHFYSRETALAAAAAGGALIIALSPLSAFANEGTTASVGATASMHAETDRMASSTKPVSTADIARIKARAGHEIDRRITALTALLGRISGMQRVADTQKVTLSAQVNAQIATLTTLKAKIAADTATADLKADAESITASYRIFALVMPQIEILASADRILTTSNQMLALSTKLQARITAAQTAGKDVVAAQAALVDFNAKVADAAIQANAAITGVSSLTPDNGDKTKMAANTAALKASRMKLEAARTDLRIASKDAGTITGKIRGSEEHKDTRMGSTSPEKNTDNKDGLKGKLEDLKLKMHASTTGSASVTQ